MAVTTLSRQHDDPTRRARRFPRPPIANQLEGTWSRRTAAARATDARQVPWWGCRRLRAACRRRGRLRHDATARQRDCDRQGPGKDQRSRSPGPRSVKDDVDKIVRDAEDHAPTKAKPNSLTRASADSLACRRSADENREERAVGEIPRVESAIEKVREAIKGDDAAAITAAIDELRSSHAMAEALYQGQQARARSRRRPVARLAAAAEASLAAEFAEPITGFTGKPNLGPGSARMGLS